MYNIFCRQLIMVYLFKNNEFSNVETKQLMATISEPIKKKVMNVHPHKAQHKANAGGDMRKCSHSHDQMKRILWNDKIPRFVNFVEEI